jgi:DNA-binding LacI/PurR family transcriptional regulator
MSTDTLSNKKSQPQRATLYEVANLAKVSKSTVSRVINDDASVAVDTRRRVLEAIAVTGYRVNQSARALASRTTGAIALAIYEDLATYFTSEFSSSMVMALQDYFFERDIQVVLVPAPDQRRQLRIEQYIQQRHVDGAILLGPVREDILLPDLLKERVPLVIGGRPARTENVSFVDIDNSGISEQVVVGLSQMGRKKIGFITGRLDNPAATDRLLGYRRGLANSSLSQDDSLVGMGNWGFKSAIAATEQILTAHPDLDAIYASNDLMASAAIQVLKESGRRTPDDVAVVGFDDTPLASSLTPKLSSVRQDPELYAQRLGELLLSQISGELTIQSSILPTQIVWRESSGTPPENIER